MSEGPRTSDLVSHANGTLCAFCDNIFWQRHVTSDIIRTGCSEIESLVDRCIICAIIYHTALKAKFPPIETWKYIKYGWMESSSSEKTILLGFWVERDGREDLLGPSITFMPLEKTNEFFNMDYVGSDEQQPEDWTPLVEKWMQSCLHTHQGCNEPKTLTTWRPTRLLDVDAPGPPNNIYLREGNEIPHSTRYMTLSHCWGSVQLIRLTTDNEANMKEGLSIDALPKTFHDAVAITKRLGVRYLWIDSLCIIQNSREDWAKESGLMCSVYGNSYCNIAATAASNSSKGCFTANHRRIKDVKRPFFVHIDWEGWQGDYCAFQNGEDIWDELEKAPLNTRAWVHQERLLSPRVLHFGLSQLAWECNETRISELSPPAAIDAARGIREFTKQRCSSLWNRTEPYAHLDEKEFLQTWSFIWSKYASLQLTHETDRLVALAGIVDKAMSIIKADFLAGLWRRDLEQQLCWWTSVPRKERHASFIAPSWSWASVPDRRADQDWAAWEDNKIILLKVLDAQVWGGSDGLKYTATGGFVQARCYLVPATRIYGQWTQILVFSPTSQSTTLELHLNLDCEEDHQLPHLWCAPIVAINDIGPKSSGGTLNGLLLAKIESGDPSAQNYRRCGYFTMQDTWRGNNIRAFWNAAYHFNKHHALPKRHDRIWKISEEWLTSDSTLENHLRLYEEADGVIQHTITIW